MSRGATLSILGLYNNDDTVLDLMAFPDGFSDEQKQITKDSILVECAELEFLYPAPEVAKSLIGLWSRKEKPYWNRVYKASLAEYNPIENYRRNETETIGEQKTEEHSGQDLTNESGTDSAYKTGAETIEKTGTETLAKTGTDTVTKTGTETIAKTGTDTSEASGSDSQEGSSESTDTHSGSDVVDNSITGYDSNTLVPHDKSETTYGHIIKNEAEGSNTTNYGRIDTITHDTEDETTYDTSEETEHDTLDTTTYNVKDESSSSSNESFTHGKTGSLTHGEKIEHDGSTQRNLLAFGNIGTMTAQDMLTQELELAKIIEVIPIIIESFKDRFCLMVY